MQNALIIDDDPVFRTIISGWLTSKGWRVVEASDGEMGMVLAQQHRPRVIICDLLMPRFNGYQVCRTLRSQPEFRKTFVIVTSTSSYQTDRLNAMDAGANEYLVKPVKQEELQRILDRLPSPESPAGAGSDTSRFGMTTKIKFWGVRGSIATPGPTTVFYGGNTSCIEVRAEGEIIILDAGTGLRPLGLSLMREFKDQAVHLTVLVTHTHWDHIQGFPFFVPAYIPRNKIRILGYEGARKGLENTLSAQMESPYFPISMQQMPGNITIQELRDLTFTIGAVKVQAAFLNHPGVCTGYRLYTSAGSIAYLPDIEPYHRFNALKGNAAPSPESLEYSRSQEAKLIEFIRDADVMAIDSQYDADEYEKHVGWGHSSVDDSVELGIKAGVKRLFLFHHDPEHDDERISQMQAHAQQLVASKGSNLIVEAAREGLEIVLHPARK